MCPTLIFGARLLILTLYLEKIILMRTYSENSRNYFRLIYYILKSNFDIKT